MISPDLFKQGMRRLASGVSLVTTIHDGVPHGLLATSVSSVSAEPDPCLLVCVNRSASAHDPIQASGVFCVNLLGTEERSWAEGFMDRPRDSRFQDREWTVLSTGAPVLPRAVASFDCQVAKLVTMNSHTLVIGRVVALDMMDEFDPLVYVCGNFTSLVSVSSGRPIVTRPNGEGSGR